MLKFFDRASDEAYWLQQESENDDIHHVLVNDEQVSSLHKIRKWAEQHPRNVLVCRYEMVEVPDPLPIPPKPSQQDIDDYEKLIEEHENNKPKSTFLSLNLSETMSWDMTLDELKRKRPYDMWKRQCDYHQNNTKEVSQWCFMFESEEDATWFRMNYIST